MVDVFEESMSSEKWRWYLCKQTNPWKWDCQETTALKALNGMSLENGQQTKAIPVFKWQPKFVDRMAIKRSLQPAVHIH